MAWKLPATELTRLHEALPVLEIPAGGGDVVEFSSEMVARLEAQIMLAANVTAVQAANEMSGTVLDMLA